MQIWLQYKLGGHINRTWSIFMTGVNWVLTNRLQLLHFETTSVCRSSAVMAKPWTLSTLCMHKNCVSCNVQILRNCVGRHKLHVYNKISGLKSLGKFLFTDVMHWVIFWIKFLLDLFCCQLPSKTTSNEYTIRQEAFQREPTVQTIFNDWLWKAGTLTYIVYNKHLLTDVNKYSGVLLMT